MLTLKQLISGVYKLRTGFNKTNSFSITKVSPLPQVQQFAVQAVFRSLTDKSVSSYKTSIVFHKLLFNVAKTPATTLPVEVFAGKTAYMSVPSKAKTPVQVSCTCKDYAYTYYYFTAVYGSHLKPYTFPDGFKHILPKPVRNTAKTPGMCKHIHELTQSLVNRRVIVS